MEILDIFANRRSVRKYTDAPLENEALDKILKAGLLAPSGRALRPWEFILVRDKRMLERLSACRESGADMLKQAAAAIVVIADTQKQDVWIEDCSVVLALAVVGELHLVHLFRGLGGGLRNGVGAEHLSPHGFLARALQ